MEGYNISGKNSIKITHLPTIMLAVGYPVYWIELYFFRMPLGRTSLLAPLLFVFLAVLFVCRNIKGNILGLSGIKEEVLELSLVEKILLAGASTLGLSLLLFSFYTALFPPHLVQEFDVLNYHITLPRQHLILNSFKHINWSSADLFLLPLDFALAPFWLATELPNKIPQFIFLLGLIGVSSSLIGYLTDKKVRAIYFLILAILGSHFIGIQMGTAMLDIVICYLFVAAIDSFLSRSWCLALIEFTFYFWAKPLFPVQVSALIIMISLAVWIFKKAGGKTISLGFNGTGDLSVFKELRESKNKMLCYFVLFSLCVAGPFVGKSIYYAGTPLFPVSPGMIKVGGHIKEDSDHWQSIVDSSQKYVEGARVYGHGISIADFVKHLWLIAVPEKGVNNAFDYPVGLPYLLCIGPFIVFLVNSMRRREFAILPSLVIFNWIMWWFSSQQSRYLYIPIILMLMLVLSMKKIRTRLCLFFLICSLGLVSLSVLRAHRYDIGKTKLEVLRDRDKELLLMSKTVRRDQPVKLPFHDVAFADFQVDVVVERGSIFVLKP